MLTPQLYTIHYSMTSFPTVAPQLIKGATGSLLTVSIPFGPSLPFEAPLNYTIIIGQSVRIPETYNLYIQCRTIKGNPKPFISWYHESEIIEGEQYEIQDDGTLVIKNVTRKRDDGIYKCVADTPDVGRDEAKSTVTVTGELTDFSLRIQLYIMCTYVLLCSIQFLQLSIDLM